MKDEEGDGWQRSPTSVKRRTSEDHYYADRSATIGIGCAPRQNVAHIVYEME
jgi:hypothetical protein